MVLWESRQSKQREGIASLGTGRKLKAITEVRHEQADEQGTCGVGRDTDSK